MQERDPEEQIDPQEPKGSIIMQLSPVTYVLLVLAIIFILYQFIGGAIALVSGGADIGSIDIKTTRIILIFGQFMLILAPVIFFARLRTPELKKTFRLKFPKLSLMFLAILGIILIQPFLQGFMYFQDQAISNIPFLKDFIQPIKELWDMLEDSILKIVTAFSPLEFAVVILVIAITPAICEEFLFRGFVLTFFRKSMKAGPAIFLSGLLFALYHFQPFSLIPLVILGIYLSYIVYYSNSILTGIVVHFLNNFFAAYFLYAYGKENFDNPQLTGSEATNALIAASFSVILFAVVIILFYRMREKESMQQA